MSGKKKDAAADELMPVVVLEMSDVDLMAMTDVKERNRLAMERGRQVAWISKNITKL